VYCSWDELIKLYNLKIPSDKAHLEYARDIFCFCCFTGLRHSDVYKLSKLDIQQKRINVITQKTIEPLYIELNNYSTNLLEKYADTESEKAFPIIPIQKMNDYLKELGKMAELTEPVRVIHFKNNEREEHTYKKYEVLTTHCGRRTFIVLAITLGIPLAVIMKWTGHESYEAMKPYIKIVDSLKEEEMRKFNTKIIPEKSPENVLSN